MIIPTNIRTQPTYPLAVMTSWRISAPPTALKSDSVERIIEAEVGSASF